MVWINYQHTGLPRRPGLATSRRAAPAVRAVGGSAVASARAPVRHRTAGCGALRAVPASRGGADLRVRHNPLRQHPPRARQHLPGLRPPDPPPRGPRPPGAAGAQHHRRGRLDPAQGPRARRGLPGAGRGRDGPVPQRHGDAQHPAPRSRAPGHRVGGRDGRPHRGPRGRRPYLHRRGHHLVRRLHLARFRPPQRLRRRRHADPGRRAGRHPRRPPPAQPARLRAVAAVGIRRAVVGLAVRAGPPRLARRVQRHVDGPARRRDRSARRRQRPDLPPPRMRAGPERGRRQPAVREALDALRDGRLRGHQDVEVAGQPRVRQRPLQGERPGRGAPRTDGPPLPRRLGMARRRHGRVRGPARRPQRGGATGRCRGRDRPRPLRSAPARRARRRPRRAPGPGCAGRDGRRRHRRPPRRHRARPAGRPVRALRHRSGTTAVLGCRYGRWHGWRHDRRTAPEPPPPSFPQ